ncbi:FecR family protein [Paraferrimonas sp. SM1919]|uniref:FecR family protein n=1 Tax=Paraferrimonas sp. SM1919 TaxID=2662263 RepID=UPI0013D8CF57|nr:FecR domain-containing protein [Paraferrimonas sp. SM1919]
MSNIYPLKPEFTTAEDEQRLEIACQWIAKIDRDLDSADNLQLGEWLAADQQNVTVFLEVAQLWDKMDALSRLSAIFPKAPKTQPRYRLGLSLAASLLMVVSLLGYIMWPAGHDNQQHLVSSQQNYQTTVGESRTVNLQDTSKITLNTNSFVQVTFTENARMIELQRGEIHIDVAHDEERPLSVIAAGQVIQAVGTAFNVEVGNASVELIVTEGKVLVVPQTELVNNSAATQKQEVNRLPSHSLAISKGEKVNLDNSHQASQQVVKVDEMDIAASLSWRSGNLIFRGETLDQAVAEIGRYTDIKFEVVDHDKLKDIRVAGMFKTGDVTGLLDVLATSFELQYERVGQDKIILKAAS